MTNLIHKINIDLLKENPKNPRLIKDERFKALVKSLKDFPQMLSLRPIVITAENIVLGGNMRLRACKEAGIIDVPVVYADDLTPEQQKEFIIKDNVSFGEWDFDILHDEYDMPQIVDWGMILPVGFDQPDKVDELNLTDEWVGMPDFEAKDNWPKIVIHFENEQYRTTFAESMNLKPIKQETQTWSFWFPERERDDLKNLGYE